MTHDADGLEALALKLISAALVVNAVFAGVVVPVFVALDAAGVGSVEVYIGTAAVPLLLALAAMAMALWGLVFGPGITVDVQTGERGGQ